MTSFADSYLGRLRAVIGPRLVMMPGVRVVVQREADGAVLLHQRGDFGTWGLPGGTPDEGEVLMDVAVRETLEETGIRPEGLVPFGFADDPAHEVWTYPNGDACHYFTLLVCATTFTGEAVADGDESLAVGWFRAGSWPDLMPVMRRTLAAYDAYRATGVFQLI